MQILKLTPDQARSLAHRAGICFEVVSQAVERSKAIGKPGTSCQKIYGSKVTDGPPSSAALVMFSHGFSDEKDNGWGGLLCTPITNQQEFNQAEAALDQTMASGRTGNSQKL